MIPGRTREAERKEKHGKGKNCGQTRNIEHRQVRYDSSGSRGKRQANAIESLYSSCTVGGGKSTDFR